MDKRTKPTTWIIPCNYRFFNLPACLKHKGTDLVTQNVGYLLYYLDNNCTRRCPVCALKR